jgi:hypothetical protein
VRVVVLVAVVTALFGVNAASSGAAGSDVLVGAGKRLNLAGDPTLLFVFARSGPNGEDASGKYWLKRQLATGETVSHRGTVDCLTVEGNRADAGAIVEASSVPGTEVGSRFRIQVTDNGNADTNLNVIAIPPEETECPIFNDPPEVPIDGNFVVHEANG